MDKMKEKKMGNRMKGGRTERQKDGIGMRRETEAEEKVTIQ